jgi:acetylornithine deacetylase
MDLQTITTKSIQLLRELISTPSFSKEEDQTAGVITRFLGIHGIEHSRILNNVFAYNKHFNSSLPTILLNSHHDTVKPNKGYTLDPFSPIEKDGKLYGLGSNDAGGPLVSLIATFLYFYEKTGLSFNLLLAATAEEEISGVNGIEMLLPHLGKIDFGIVGEPTQMQMAVAERGLLVLDCTANGVAGHAARNEGENALYKALDDINWIRNYKFDKVSPLLGPVKMSATVIQTENRAHNVVPPVCQFVIDTRINELYTFEEVLDTIQKNIKSTITPRSTRLRSTSIALDHPLVVSGKKLGRTPYGSPTTSDKALMPFPTLKLGPGDSARSHTADEFIYIQEISEGIQVYVKLLEGLETTSVR